MSEVKEIETVKSSAGSLVLPSGYLDEGGKVLKNLDIREISGEEEDLLGAKRMAVHRKLQRVIANCITNWDGVDPNQHLAAVKALPTVDKMYLLVQLRIISLGELYSFEFKCPNEDCRKKSNQTVDLSTLEVRGLKHPDKRVHETTLPKSGQLVRWKVFDGEAEDKITGMKQASNLASLAIYARILDIDGEPPKSIKQISHWNLSDRDYLRSQFIDEEGELETNIEIECPFCLEEVESQIAINQPGFFFPQESSKRSKII